MSYLLAVFVPVKDRIIFQVLMGSTCLVPGNECCAVEKYWPGSVTCFRIRWLEVGLVTWRS